MTLLDPLANALSTIVESEKRRLRECIVQPASKLMGQVLRVMQKNGYIGEFEFIDDGRSGKFKIQLLGRINRCGVVKPRYSVRLDELEFWEKRYLPSRDLGTLVLTTPAGVISNKEAKEKRSGGRLLAYIYQMKKGCMMTVKMAERIVEIPAGVRVELSGRTVKVTGPKGTLREDLTHLPVNLNLEEGRLRVTVAWPRKREYAMAGTAAAHLRNMVKGVTEGFRYRLRMVHAHFPITVKVRQDQKLILIENFTGERSPRTARIIGDADVKVSGDEIVVEGADLRDVSQTAANIESATKIKDKDQRVFLDGIYITEKA